MGWLLFIFLVIILLIINSSQNKKNINSHVIKKTPADKERIKENRIFILKKFRREYIEGEKEFALPSSVIDYWINQFAVGSSRQNNLSGKEYIYSDSPLPASSSIFAIIRYIHICNALYSLNYLKKLAIKRCQLVTQDEYDDFLENEDAWFRELNKFLVSRYDSIYPYLLVDNLYIQYANSINEGNLLVAPENVEDVLKLNDESSVYFDSIARCIKYAENYLPEYFIEDNDLNGKNAPIVYEIMVEKIFSSHGWSARRTSTTGDQGADVIAEKNGVKVVAQCKYYSGSVGNKAVQEVVAARGFYKAHIALVVSNSLFTQSAMRLANSLNVVLLNHNDLTDFIENL